MFPESVFTFSPPFSFFPFFSFLCNWHFYINFRTYKIWAYRLLPLMYFYISQFPKQKKKKFSLFFLFFVADSSNPKVRPKRVCKVHTLMKVKFPILKCVMGIFEIKFLEILFPDLTFTIYFFLFYFRNCVYMSFSDVGVRC